MDLPVIERPSRVPLLCYLQGWQGLVQVALAVGGNGVALFCLLLNLAGLRVDLEQDATGVLRAFLKTDEESEFDVETMQYVLKKYKIQGFHTCKKCFCQNNRLRPFEYPLEH